MIFGSWICRYKDHHKWSEPWPLASVVVQDDKNASWSVIRVAKKCFRCACRDETDIVVWYSRLKDGSIKVISQHGTYTLRDQALHELLEHRAERLDNIT